MRSPMRLLLAIGALPASAALHVGMARRAPRADCVRMQAVPDSEVVAAVLLAGGSGKRMGAAMPKQFLPLEGKPVLQRSLELLQQIEAIGRKSNPRAQPRPPPAQPAHAPPVLSGCPRSSSSWAKTTERWISWRPRPARTRASCSPRPAPSGRTRSTTASSRHPSTHPSPDTPRARPRAARRAPRGVQRARGALL